MQSRVTESHNKETTRIICWQIGLPFTEKLFIFFPLKNPERILIRMAIQIFLREGHKVEGEGDK